MNDLDRYPLTVFWSEEDGAFVAEARDLPGCSAVGDTREVAVQEARDAIASWIEAARAAGNPVPEPSSELAECAYSGKLLLRMPRSLHARLARRASNEGVSLNQWVVHRLSNEEAHDAHYEWIASHVVFQIMGGNKSRQVVYSGGMPQQFNYSPPSSTRAVTAERRTLQVN